MSRKCSVLVVSHNTLPLTSLCVKGTIKLATASHLTVIDNGSIDGTLELLRKAAKDGKLTLIERNVRMLSTEHGRAIDLYIKHDAIAEYMLILDSDTYPLIQGFDEKLIEMSEGADIFGTAHFRDQTIVHPSTMLIKKIVLDSPVAGTSFMLSRHGSAITDTGVNFCNSAKMAGFKVKPVSQEEMKKVIRHLWRGTRGSSAHITGRQQLDDHPMFEFDKEIRAFLNDPAAVELAKFEL
jgi:glycosyltransferase involved in cell wall biosynthesis